jgi:hypothetical protein
MKSESACLAFSIMICVGLLQRERWFGVSGYRSARGDVKYGVAIFADVRKAI